MKGTVPGERHGLRGRESHEERADQSRPARHGDAADRRRARVEPGIIEGAAE